MKPDVEKIKELYYRYKLDHFLISIKPYTKIVLFFSLLTGMFFFSQGNEIIKISADRIYHTSFLGKIGLFFLWIYGFLFLCVTVLVWCNQSEFLDNQSNSSIGSYNLVTILKFQNKIKAGLVCFLPLLFFGYCIYFKFTWILLFALSCTLLLFFTALTFIEIPKQINNLQNEYLASKNSKGPTIHALSEEIKKYNSSIKLKEGKIYKIGKLEKSNRFYFWNYNIRLSMLLPKNKKIRPFKKLSTKEYDILLEEVLSVKQDSLALIEKAKEDISEKENELLNLKYELDEIGNKLLYHIDQKFYKNDHMSSFQYFGFGLFLITALIFIINPSNLLVTSIFGPFLGIIVGLVFVFNIFLLIFIHGRKDKRPYVLIALIWIGICTCTNNNHQIRVIDSEPFSLEREGLSDYLDSWVESKAKLGLISQDSVDHIYLISAEGGGIRSAYWTTNVINKLENEFSIIDKTISLSGVSGGSIGVATFCSKYCDPKTDINKVFEADLITPTITGLLIPEVVQKLIPWPIQSLDRTRRLEDSWSNAINDNVAQGFLDKGVVSAWNLKKESNLPAVFFNSTRVEDGRKAIISNIRLEEDFNSHDIIDIVGKDIPIKSAAMASARFPFVTPPAQIIDKNKDAWGNIVDGGYFDNSGLHTTFQIVKGIRKNELMKQYKIKPIIIYLKNSRETFNNSSDLFIETTSPLRTFLNSWDARVDYYIPDLVSLSDEYNFDLVTFELNRFLDGEELNLPLAWTFSSDTKNEMDRILEEFGKSGSQMNQIQKNNFSTYNLIKELENGQR